MDSRLHGNDSFLVRVPLRITPTRGRTAFYAVPHNYKNCYIQGLKHETQHIQGLALGFMLQPNPRLRGGRLYDISTAYLSILSQKFAAHLFADKVEPYFYDNQLNYAGVVMYEVVLDDEDMAMELFYAIQGEEMSFYDVAHKYIEDQELRRKGGYRGVLSRKDLKPEISAAVFAAKPPEVIKPIVTSKGIHLILVEEIIQPELDNKLRSQIVSDLFDEWAINLWQQWWGDRDST